MLSQVERGEVNPTVAVALAVATALGVTLDELLETGRNKPRITVIRANDTQFVYRSDEQCTIRTLSPLHPERTLEFYEITLQPLAELRSAPHFSGTVEYLTVRSGAVRVESGVDRVDLGRGDSVEYPADVPHAIVNRRRSVAVVYLIDFALAGQ
jgi:mannose-6-phosphate isomerase-like protein (cupin superfamily)